MENDEYALTQRHYNAVAKPLRMLHQILRRQKKVSYHLHGLGILQHDMLPFTLCLLKLLMYKLAKLSPFVSLAHKQGMVATRDEIVGDIGHRPVAVDGALSVDERFDETAVCDDYGC